MLRQQFLVYCEVNIGNTNQQTWLQDNCLAQQLESRGQRVGGEMKKQEEALIMWHELSQAEYIRRLSP